MKIKVNVILNQANINKIQQAMEKALPLTMEAMKTEIMTMQVVPKEIGDLEESAVVGVNEGKGFISYNTPYARRLYYNPQYNFRTDKNPNAQGRWLDPFIHGAKKEWLAMAFGTFLKQQSGGVIK